MAMKKLIPAQVVKSITKFLPGEIPFALLARLHLFEMERPGAIMYYLEERKKAQIVDQYQRRFLSLGDMPLCNLVAAVLEARYAFWNVPNPHLVLEINNERIPRGSNVEPMDTFLQLIRNSELLEYLKANEDVLPCADRFFQEEIRERRPLDWLALRELKTRTGLAVFDATRYPLPVY